MPDFLLFVILALFVAWLVLARRFSFAGQHPADYAATRPAIDIRHHLAGPLLCEGVIYGPTGRVTSRFVAEMEGSWDGNAGRLSEHFRYAGGNEQHREWRLTLDGSGAIRAEADDIVGRGEGWQKGAALMLRYRIRLPETAGGWVLDVTDWMYLLENGAIINRSQFRKFGVKVAELVATMRPAEPGEAAARMDAAARGEASATARGAAPSNRTEAA